MFSAIGRWFKALGYLLTGQIDAARRTLDSNPHVVRAKFDEIIREKTKRVRQYKDAVARFLAQKEGKVAIVRSLSEEIQRLGALKTGALAKARQATEKLKAAGKSMEEIKADEDYKRCLAAFNDFSSTLAEKQSRVAELETDIAEYERSIAEHKIQLESMRREIDKVKAESAATEADLIMAQQEKDIADTLSGIAQDGTAEELQRMRELRQQVKAEARISKELAGTSTRAQEEEFLAYARKSAAADEFDALIGLAEASSETTQAPTEPAEKSALPE